MVERTMALPCLRLSTGLESMIQILFALVYCIDEVQSSCEISRDSSGERASGTMSVKRGNRLSTK